MIRSANLAHAVAEVYPGRQTYEWSDPAGDPELAQFRHGVLLRQ